MSKVFTDDMLKKLEKKITQMASNKNQTSQSEEKNMKQVVEKPKIQDVYGASLPKFAALLNKYSREKTTQQTTQNNREQAKSNQNGANEEQSIQQRSNTNKNSNNLGQVSESQKKDDDERIDPAFLQKMVMEYKMKAKQAQSKNIGNQSTKTPARKSVARPQIQMPKNVEPASPNTRRSANMIKPSQPVNQPPQKLPKLATINNLLKLSTKLPSMQFLKQVNYKGNSFGIVPIKLLYIFCVQKLIYTVYMNNGMQKVKQKSGNVQFLTKQICKALANLLQYIKINQAALLHKILQAVFTRFNISQHFSRDYLYKCIRENRSLFNNTGADIQTILNQVQNKKITSAIFKSVPKCQKPIRYDNYKQLSLQPQLIDGQFIDDPQKYQQKCKLYYFKTELKPKQIQIKPPSMQQKSYKINGSLNDSNDDFMEQLQAELDNDNNFQTIHQQEQDQNILPPQIDYQPAQFQISIRKTNLPQNVKVFRTNNNKDFQVMNPNVMKTMKPKKPTDVEQGKQQLQATRRTRPSPTQMVMPDQMEQSKRDLSDYVNPQQIQEITKQKVFAFIDEYILSRPEIIAKKVAQIWKIKPQQLAKMLNEEKQNNINGNNNLLNNPLPAKKTPPKQPTPLPQPTKAQPSKAQMEKQVLNKMINVTQQYEKKGIKHKQLVKELLKIMEERGLSNESKQSILQKWKEFRSKSIRTQ